MDRIKLPRPGAPRAERVAIFLLGALMAVGLWQAYGVLLYS